ncbi:hypothetical protein SNOG_07876 [Parastagonospora nodorum SN15]|uniref:Uncharacterized protein n=1 Tax=Phaeosphaeria nodorum (strain SN15 / ATCC MYA-4574 / FGSC 10173) TaxID=321614 RepID=Q0UK38_PHANO|nr:hypothetical protein SNOG_07876 [Parastagonospora nodorum SN15]EAT84152.1 hypothetical protein SNOG_07876 [Parastagonospora nodorum SN15]
MGTLVTSSPWSAASMFRPLPRRLTKFRRLHRLGNILIQRQSGPTTESAREMIGEQKAH